MSQSRAHWLSWAQVSETENARKRVRPNEPGTWLGACCRRPSPASWPPGTGWLPWTPWRGLGGVGVGRDEMHAAVLSTMHVRARLRKENARKDVWGRRGDKRCRGQPVNRHLIPESDKRACDRNTERQRGSGSAEVPLCPQTPPSSHTPSRALLSHVGTIAGR